MIWLSCLIFNDDDDSNDFLDDEDDFEDDEEDFIDIIEDEDDDEREFEREREFVWLCFSCVTFTKACSLSFNFSSKGDFSMTIVYLQFVPWFLQLVQVALRVFYSG